MTEALGILETNFCTPALAATDRMEKTAGIRVLQAELNDFNGVVVKILGDVAAVRAALEAGAAEAERMGGKPKTAILPRVEPNAMTAIESRPERSPLLNQPIVFIPDNPSSQTGKSAVEKTESFALGLIETQGFTAVFEAIDTACKAANVEVVAKEKLGGGYITVVIRGDVAAVKAAVEAGQSRVGALGKLIAAHVIPRPSQAVLGLLPK